MRSANTFEDLLPSRAAIMFNPLGIIQSSTFPPISFMSKLEWKHLSNCPASDLEFPSLEVIDVEDKDEITYNQQYIVATSTKRREYQFPPKATQPPNTMSIWIF